MSTAATLADIAALPETIAAQAARIDALEALVVRLVVLDDVWVPTAEALRLTGIKSDNTLRAEAERPGAVLKRKKVGRSVAWSRNSCLLYAHTRRGFSLPPAVAAALRPAA